ncbi:MAG: FISUMP domain-containing protein, partial [Patescibacteria group bacterium]|nr:FISUMP domain-containing protein [Patescibacteria group bacterium]
DLDNISTSQDAVNINYNPTSGSFDAMDITYGSGGGTGNALAITQLGAGNVLLFNDEASDTSPFVIDGAGSVGIGTTTLSGAKFKIALDSFSVSDSYDDQSKIASLSNAAVSIGKLQISEAACGTYTVQDADGNSYDTVLIGTQCWLKQNLRTGTKITSCTNGYVGVCTTGGDTVQNQTNNSIIEKYCYSDTDANCTTDGGLYQWAEAMQYKDGCSNTTSLQPTEPVQGICPTGWHIPTDAQQYTLENYLKDGANSCVSTRSGWDCDTAGTKLKVGGASGFEGILAGNRNTNGSFGNRLTIANLWSSSQYDASNAWERNLGSGNSMVSRYNFSKAYGFSVRCLKD